MVKVLMSILLTINHSMKVDFKKRLLDFIIFILFSRQSMLDNLFYKEITNRTEIGSNV